MPPRGNKRYQAFISYTAEDDSWARKLHNDLIEKKGIPTESVFLAEPSTHAGELWREKVRAALASSSYLVVLWSSKSRKSEWVDHEIVAFENLINTPGAELIQVYQRMIFISLDADNKVYKDIQMIKTLKRANAYDPATPTIDKLLQNNKQLWDDVVNKVYEAITADEISIPVPQLVLATKNDSLANMDFSNRPQFGGFTRSLQDLLATTIQIQSREELIARYGPNRTDWKPIFGNDSTIDQLLVTLRDEINRISRSPTIRWEPVDDGFWNTDDEARSIANSLSSGLALIIIDPISLYDPVVLWRLTILREEGCFDNENAVFLVLSPSPMPAPSIGFRELIRDAARSVFNDYYLPGVRKIPYARCSVNFGDDMGMMRPVLATIKNYFYQNQRPQAPVQTSVGDGR